MVKDPLPGEGEPTRKFFLRKIPALRAHPIGVIASEERDGRDRSGHDAPLSSLRVVESGRMRRKSSPTNGSLQTELVKLLWRVAADTTRKHLRLPSIRSHLKPLKLSDHLFQSATAVHLRAGCNALPAEEPPH